MNRLILLFFLFLAAPTIVPAQSDPLNPSYMPTIDKNPADYPTTIWITDTMQKVRQDSGSPGATHWGTFYGTQNEFVDFQVHVSAIAASIPNLNVTVSSFVQSAPNNYTISNASPQIIVYREAYMNVTGYVTSTSPTFYGAQGHYPDILIPALDPYWGQTTDAFPYTVLVGNNQSAWVDVLIPSSAPAGYYLGSVTVKSGSSILATMPIIIGVWQWPNSGYMPSTATLKSEETGWSYEGLCTQMFNGNGQSGVTTLCGKYPGAGGSEDNGNTLVWLDADLLLKDHRYSSGGAANVYPGSGSFTTYTNTVGPILNGTCLHGGMVCPILPNSKNTTKEIAVAGGSGNASAAIWKNWQSNFDNNGWGTAGNLPLFDYLYDEPQGLSAFTTLVANATTRHGYVNPGIPELVTTDIFFLQKSQSGANAFSTSVCGSASCIQNSIDVMVTNITILEPIGGPLQPKPAYQSWLSGATVGIPRAWWSYQGCSDAGTCSNGIVGGSTATWPNYDIDGKPAANRAFEWLTFLHGQTGELYYAGDYCMPPNSGGLTCGCTTPGSCSVQDPWISVYAFGGWGDGTLVYVGGVKPGTSNYMGSSVATPIILPSVRLKHIRDGMQDYEYLYALTNAGKGAIVSAQISSWITNSYTFETTGSGLEAARISLGNALHQLTYSGLLSSPTGLTATVE